MTLTLNIPKETERSFRETWGNDLDRAVVEALIIEGYRSKKYGEYDVRRLLGLSSRWEAEEWLAARGVRRNYTPDDLDQDLDALDRQLGPIR